MAIPRITRDYADMSDTALLAKASSIHSSMTDNPHFPDPHPSLAELKNSITDYSDALAEASTKDTTKKNIKNQLKNQLVVTLTRLSLDVTNAAAGNATKLDSAGFTMAKSRQSRQISTPQDFRLSTGLNSGQIVSRIRRVSAAISYLHQCCTGQLTATSEWISKPSSRAKYVFSDLEPGKKYWFRVVAIGANGQVAYSDVMSRIAI